ncbi:ferredoxin-type protein NapF [Thalassotalea maritima]|uniref:ferredoxin-type protein NapF n=1 Tax=Thalassotalea maritima TaxID=3242416 RepID=UPI003528EAFE
MSDARESISISRRNFFRGKKMLSTPNFRLPWVLNEAIFLQGCTQCGDCISSCPEKIISKDDDGFPKIDFFQGECTFCQRCVDVCQQPLFTAPSETTPWQGHLNIKDNCLASNNILCQSCQDSCEQQAISFVYRSAIPTPEINQDNCNACGACISVCPSQSIELLKLESNPS